MYSTGAVQRAECISDPLHKRSTGVAKTPPKVHIYLVQLKTPTVGCELIIEIAL